MRLLTILQTIVTQLGEIWTKIRKLNHYWSTTETLTVSTTNGSGYTVSSATCQIDGNMANIVIQFKMSAKKTAGTSIRAKVCALTITGWTNVCSDDTWVMQTTTGINGTTGPLITGQLLNTARTNANTMTCNFYLGGNVAGATNTTDTYIFRFITPVPRKITLS